MHQSKHVPGAIIASLAVPWGGAKGDGDLGGYHLVWPRDMVEAAGGLLAVGARAEAREALTYLQATQEVDGSWPQNMWTPLVWAHAEYLKLVRSLADGRVFDTPPQPLERYVRRATGSRFVPWRFNHKIRELTPGRVLRLEVLAPAKVHWSADGWRTVLDEPTRDTGLGVHVADLATQTLAQGAEIVFTFHWPESDRWEETDFSVGVHEGS